MRRLAFSLLALAASAHAQVPLSATPDPQSSIPLFLSEFDGEVYALGDAAPDPQEVQGTWRTDGTPEGTDYLFGLNWRGGAVTLDGALYFMGVDSPEDGAAGPTDLYRLDGETAVRLTHRPTGTVVNERSSRSQFRNKALAVQELRRRLEEANRPVTPRRQTKPTRSSKRRRLEAKRQRSEKKQLRRPPDV